MSDTYYPSDVTREVVRRSRDESHADYCLKRVFSDGSGWSTECFDIDPVEITSTMPLREQVFVVSSHGKSTRAAFTSLIREFVMTQMIDAATSVDVCPDDDSDNIYVTILLSREFRHSTIVSEGMLRGEILGIIEHAISQ